MSRRRTYKRRRNWKKSGGGNPLLRKKVGNYYRTSYTQIFPMVTSNLTPLWCPLTVNLLTQITDSVDASFYKDANAVQLATREATESIFDQKKITGIRMKMIIPQAAGSTYTDRNITTGTVTAVNI